MKLNKNQEGLYTGRCYFIRKAKDLEVLKTDSKLAELSGAVKKTFIIKKIIELDLLEYKDFCTELLLNQTFMAENINLMGLNADGIWHCLLISTEPVNSENMDDILVQSEGYSYARYASPLGTVEI